MLGPERETVYQALFELGLGLSWSGGPFNSSASSRRPKMPDDVHGLFPVLFQAEYVEAVQQVTRMPQKRTWEVAWIVYMFFGADDALPATTINNFLDAVDSLFPPQGLVGTTQQTLGGLVHSVKVEGTIEKRGGNIDPLVGIVIPIRILVP